jgi:GGDEF domain-containing protein
VGAGAGGSFGARGDVYDETGIYARWFFEQRLSEECSRALRKGERIVLVCLAVDDRSALTAGYTLWRNLRDYDLIGRTARTQFVIAALDALPEDADSIVERLRKVIGVECDVGIAVFPEEADDAKNLLALVTTRVLSPKAN